LAAGAVIEKSNTILKIFLSKIISPYPHESNDFFLDKKSEKSKNRKPKVGFV